MKVHKVPPVARVRKIDYLGAWWRSGELCYVVIGSDDWKGQRKDRFVFCGKFEMCHVYPIFEADPQRPLTGIDAEAVALDFYQRLSR